MYQLITHHADRRQAEIYRLFLTTSKLRLLISLSTQTSMGSRSKIVCVLATQIRTCYSVLLIILKTEVKEVQKIINSSKNVSAQLKEDLQPWPWGFFPSMLTWASKKSRFKISSIIFKWKSEEFMTWLIFWNR